MSIASIVIIAVFAWLAGIVLGFFWINQLGDDLNHISPLIRQRRTEEYSRFLKEEFKNVNLFLLFGSFIIAPTIAMAALYTKFRMKRMK